MTSRSASKPRNRLAVAGFAGFASVPVLLVVLITLLAGGAQQLQEQCGTGGPELPDAFNGPGSLGGVAGTGLTPAQIEAVRSGSPYAGERITAGRYRATAYGPPWGGIQGTGQAMSGGIVLNGGAPRMYAIAVDPLVIDHGTLVYAWPNPFGWRGPFLAADTGGAIDGRHIDFYDWRGRVTQTRWGSRTVRLSSTPLRPGGPPATTPQSGSGLSTVADIARRLRGRPVGVAVADASGRLVVDVGAARPNLGRSMSKALVLVALTRRAARRPLSDTERGLAAAMIERSDNAAASRLYARVGGVAVDRAARAAGMSEWRRDIGDPVYTLGESTVTAGDFARLFARIDVLVPRRHRAFAEDVLSRVEGAGRFGLLSAGLPEPLLSKGGWSPEGARGWTVNQAARVTIAGERFGVAVVLGGQASFADGAEQIRQVATALAAAAAAPISTDCTAVVPSGPLGRRIGAIARSHLGAGPSIAGFEPPSVGYAWCAWFATNVWRKAGVPIDISAFSGAPYEWAQSRGLLFKKLGEPPRSRTPPVGSALMFGSGPESTTTSLHLNLVDSVLKDGSVMITGGNQSGRVTRYGPCRLSRADPAHLSGPTYCDTRPIYGIAMPGSGGER